MQDEIKYHYQCQRCKAKATEYVCQTCRPINCFCSKCDSFVHNLPSKKNHKRDFANSDSSNEKILIKENNESKENAYANKTTNFNTILSSPMNTNKNFSQNNSMVENQHNMYSFQEPYSVPSQQIYQSPSANISYIDEKKFNTSIYSHGTRVYTKEYVNELKNIFQKEKDELIFKNSSLQNNLDRLKISFTDQISQLQKELEENKNKNNLTIRMIDEENTLKLKSIINEKDNQIEDLTRKLEDYKKCNEELIEQIRESIKVNKQEKSEFKDDIKILSQEINNKEQQIEQMRNKFKNKIDTILNDSEAVKKELIDQHEMKLNRINREKENLNKILVEKENEINSLLNQRRADENYFNHVINDLKNENETLQNSVFNFKNENVTLIEETEKLKKNVNLVNEENDVVLRNTDRMKKEITIKNEKINCLENSIISLKAEIDSLINKNNILQQDNEVLSKSVTNIRSGLSEKIAHITYIENQNSFFQRENAELKSQLNRFEKMYLGKLNSYD